MSAPLTFAIVGTGRMAATMMHSFAGAEGLKVSAVTSASQTRAQEFADRFAIPHAFGDLDEMLAHSGIDAVYIANSPADHATATIAALSAGKPVLCEKPCATSPAEMEQILAAARTHNQLFMEGLWSLTLPAYVTLGEMVRSGDYGTPQRLAFEFGYPVVADSHSALFEVAGGGVLRDRGVYGLALARALLGPVRTLHADLQRDETGVDLSASLQLTHQDGAVSQIGVSLEALMGNTVDLSCSTGFLGLAAPSIRAETVLHRKMAPQSLGAAGGSSVMDRLRAFPQLRRLQAARNAPKPIRRSFGTAPYIPQLKHFAGLIRAGATESPLVPHALSHDVQALVAQALGPREAGR